MTPAWILQILTCSLVGSFAGSIAMGQAPFHRIPILVAGLTMQGLGFWLSIPVLGFYFVHLVSDGLPSPGTRPGMFLSASPAAYTVFAVIHMANALPDEGYFLRYPMAKQVVSTLAITFGIFVWCFAFFLFCLAFVAVISGAMTGELCFHLTWYSFVFPQVGLAHATFSIGKAINSAAIIWVATVLSSIITIVYFVVLLANIRAVWKRQILWPGKDEDDG